MRDTFLQRYITQRRPNRPRSRARPALAARLHASLDAQTRRLIDDALRQRDDVGVLAIRIERLDVLCEAFGPDVTQALENGLTERMEELADAESSLLSGFDGEMLLLVPGLDGLSGQRFMERVLERLTQSIDLLSITIAPRVAIGASYAPTHGTEAATLIRRARIARSAACERFMPISCYEVGRDDVWASHLALIGQLRHALDRDEIVLHYQPKVRAATGEIFGAEALVRWQHPERGLLPPGAFIPLAETSGVIVSLGDHVLKLAVRQLSAWARQGCDLELAVNLCARDIEDATLIKRVRQYLRDAEVQPSRLVIEVTESAVMHDAELAVAVLRELQACGVRISLDDFGTGHSSLAKLRDMPVDELKIDRAFVSGIQPDSIEATIVQAVVNLGRAAGCTIVAEGVETIEENALLTELGADLIQGWLIAKAMPVDEFEHWLQGLAESEAPARAA